VFCLDDKKQNHRSGRYMLKLYIKNRLKLLKKKKE